MNKIFLFCVLTFLCLELQWANAGRKPISKPKPNRPPGILHSWYLHEHEIGTMEAACKEGEDYMGRLDKEICEEKLSGEIILKRLLECNRLYTDFGTIGSVFNVAYRVSTSENVRNKCEEFDGRLAKALLKIKMSKKIYGKLVAIQSNEIALEGLSNEYKKCLARFIENGQRNGLHIVDPKVAEEVETINSEIIKLQLEFEKNLPKNDTILEFTETELQGLQPELNDLKKKKNLHGKIPVNLNLPLLTKCVNPETRRKVKIAQDSRAMENVEIIRQLILARAKLAKLLGYTSYADYVVNPRMARNPGTVLHFLEKELLPAATERWNNEIKQMLEFKAEECKKSKWACDGNKLEMWDYNYFYDKIAKQKHNINSAELSKYFPLEVVLNGMFKIFEEVFGLKISFVASVESWHEDVLVYQVIDGQTGVLLGYFYLDLYQRTGKYGYTTMLIMQQGCAGEGEDKDQKPVGLIICNFTKGGAKLPTLLYHSEVEDLLGRFAHILRLICSTERTSLFNSGYGLQGDFEEATAGMLQNWCYEGNTLRRMSMHCETGEELPFEMVQKLVERRARDGGSYMLRQLVWAITDQKLHNLEYDKIRNDSSFDALKIYKETVLKLEGFEVPEGTNRLATWVHLGGNWGATYYSYLWSGVYGDDMYTSTFKKEGVINKAVGARLRNEVMAPGASQEPQELLKKFLNREDTDRNMHPFLVRNGLQATTA